LNLDTEDIYKELSVLSATGEIRQMSRLLRDRYALSTVITTLIILVVSILLASVLTYFATNVVSTRVQEESLHVTNQHIWLNPLAKPGDADYCVASLTVLNTGGRDVVISKIAVRGQDCSWSDAANNKFVVFAVTNGPIRGEMSFVGNFTVNPNPGDNIANIGSKDYDFAVATTAIVLPSGSTMLIYIINPDSMSVNDVGLTISVALHSAQAVYYSEANVQAHVAQ
jgi:hypothetical protein